MSESLSDVVTSRLPLDAEVCQAFLVRFLAALFDVLPNVSLKLLCCGAAELTLHTLLSRFYVDAKAARKRRTTNNILEPTTIVVTIKRRPLCCKDKRKASNIVGCRGEYT